MPARRLPVSVKQARGTLHQAKERRHREKLAESRKRLQADAGKVGSPPADLTTRERTVWAELAPLVERVGAFSETDAPTFRLLVGTTARIRDARTSPGSIPSLTKTAASLSHSLGLTPAARVAVGLAEDTRPEDGDLPPPGEPVAWAEQERIRREVAADFFRPLPCFCAKHFTACFPVSEGGTRPD